MKAGHRVEIKKDQDRLKLTAYDHRNRVIGETISGLDKVVDGDRSIFEGQRKQQEAFETTRDEVFKDLGFCEPKLAPNLKSLSVYHDPPLTY